MQAFVLDESIFNIEEGRNAQYYKEAEWKLAEISRFTSRRRRSRHARVLIRANESLTTIFAAQCSAPTLSASSATAGVRRQQAAASGDADALIKIRFLKQQRNRTLNASRSLKRLCDGASQSSGR